MPDELIKTVSSLKGMVALPGDKSISHRAFLLNAIANGKSKISGYLKADDVKSTLSCLRQLGVIITTRGNDAWVKGVGLQGLQAPAETLDVGNSGTTIRLLSGIMAAQNFSVTLSGDASLNRRPMRRVIEPLDLMGARIESAEYKAPLTISGRPLRAIDYASPIASAQVKSCVLLAGIYARGLSRVTEPYMSRDHTERMLAQMGVKIHRSAAMSAIKGPAELTACDIDVPADISAAAFFLVAALILPDAHIEMLNVGANETRTGILDALAAMQGQISIDQQTELNNEPRCRLRASSSKLVAHDMGGALVPRIIDEIPILAVAATQAHGVTTITNAKELRVKESDRLAAVATNLKKMGAKVRELDDGLVITGPTPLKGAEIDSFGDHRIAMAFAVAGLVAEGETLIKNTECVDISFPGFFDTLSSLHNG